MAQTIINKNQLPDNILYNYDWVKPADWIDIRSGAVPNSICLLAGHPANYSKYNTCGWKVQLSNTSHNYQVFIDGNLYGTYAHNTSFNITWSTSNITTGYPVTYPETLTTHIIRITPETSGDNITGIEHVSVSSQTVIGILWAHFTTTSSVNMTSFLGRYSPRVYSAPLEAITAADDILYCGGLEDAFGPANDGVEATGWHPHIKHFPTFDFGGNAVQMGGAFVTDGVSGTPKKIKLQNGSTSAYSNGMFVNNVGLEEIETNKFYFIARSSNNFARMFMNNTSIKRLPDIDNTLATSMLNFCTNAVQLEPTFFDAQQATLINALDFHGDSTHFVSGLKGIKVSSQAPFNRSTSPQLNVSYTGLDRAALVGLFNSMPTVTDSQVCNITGCTGANDLDSTDLAIATGKGWTVTR